jgi:hypothetical protein
LLNNITTLLLQTTPSHMHHMQEHHRHLNKAHGSHTRIHQFDRTMYRTKYNSHCYRIDPQTSKMNPFPRTRATIPTPITKASSGNTMDIIKQSKNGAATLQMSNTPFIYSGERQNLRVYALTHHNRKCLTHYRSSYTRHTNNT